MSKKGEVNFYWRAQFLAMLNYTQIFIRKSSLLCLYSTISIRIKNQIVMELVQSEFTLNGEIVSTDAFNEAINVLGIQLISILVVIGATSIPISRIRTYNNRFSFDLVKKILKTIILIFLIIQDFNISLTFIGHTLVFSLLMRGIYIFMIERMWRENLGSVLKATSFWELPGSESIKTNCRENTYTIEEYYQVLKALVPDNNPIAIDSLNVCMKEALLPNKEASEIVNENLEVVYRIENTSARLKTELNFEPIETMDLIDDTNVL
ncbi:hypothetical protein [Enterococcus mundtii]|uniref:hypothetical protein n=1 Tax=Enterococcus mundtii TaxID=53346 RepID=UPI0013783967|nr:hypothetical protein [Enterococcus mundtii]MCW6015878.1 hypothetical protein [Serratia marcescens]MEC3942482.1 hypothetical protein [Enterococcus mundtii]NBA63749.1 hypothetical protein [Enterococcus mundtii]